MKIDTIKISRGAIFILFLILIRSVFEIKRLNNTESGISMELVLNYLNAIIITAISCAVCLALSYYHKNKLIILIFCLTIIFLVYYKLNFLIA